MLIRQRRAAQLSAQPSLVGGDRANGACSTQMASSCGAMAFGGMTEPVPVEQSSQTTPLDRMRLSSLYLLAQIETTILFFCVKQAGHLMTILLRCTHCHLTNPPRSRPGSNDHQHIYCSIDCKLRGRKTNPQTLLYPDVATTRSFIR